MLLKMYLPLRTNKNSYAKAENKSIYITEKQRLYC
jgi:hypothetical protein